MTPTWSERVVPRPVAALWTRGESARRLAIHLLRSPGRWKGVAGRGWIALLGEELPWIEDAIWLGTDPEAPSLLFPTLYEPDLHPALIERSVHQRFSRPCGPYAVIPPLCGGPLLLALGAARPLATKPLQDWLGR